VRRPVARVRRRELAALRAELGRRSARTRPARWNADPEDVRRSVAKLVLALVEFLRKLLERQALRRMDAGSLTPEEIEAIGLALMRLERTIRELARRFRLSPRDLDLDLGPLGRLG
jgi:gas vesicle protein GvpK